MGNVYSLKCPELRIELRVGANGQLWTGVDKQGRDYHALLSKFMYTCIRKEMFYVGENANNGAVDDMVHLDFDPERDYDTHPVTDAELAAKDADDCCAPYDGWVIPSSEQLGAIKDAVAKGELGQLTGVTLHTEPFKKVEP